MPARCKKIFRCWADIRSALSRLLDASITWRDLSIILPNLLVKLKSIRPIAEIKITGLIDRLKADTIVWVLFKSNITGVQVNSILIRIDAKYARQLYLNRLT